MIDVYERIKPLLSFDSEDDFYYLQILQRRKDNPDTTEKNTVVIKDYFIKSFEYFDKKYPEIKELCKCFNARAGLRLNKRSFKKVAFRTLNNITAQMMQDDYQSAKQAFTKACGQCHADSNKKWIIDLDGDDVKDIDEMMRYINRICLPDDENKIIIQLPTKNGIHLITKPFDIKTFSNRFKNIEIHKDNPINIFVPGV